jgi:hypothetical protein
MNRSLFLKVYGTHQCYAIECYAGSSTSFSRISWESYVPSRWLLHRLLLVFCNLACDPQCRPSVHLSSSTLTYVEWPSSDSSIHSSTAKNPLCSFVLESPSFVFHSSSSCEGEIGQLVCVLFVVFFKNRSLVQSKCHLSNQNTARPIKIINLLTSHTDSIVRM